MKNVMFILEKRKKIKRKKDASKKHLQKIDNIHQQIKNLNRDFYYY